MIKARIIAYLAKGIIETVKTGQMNLRTRLVTIYLGGKVKKMMREDREMESKPWYNSKSVWTAIVGVLLGAVQPISAAFGHPVTVPAWVYEILGAFGLYSLRDGQGKPLQ